MHLHTGSGYASLRWFENLDIGVLINIRSHFFCLYFLLFTMILLLPPDVLKAENQIHMASKWGQSITETLQAIIMINAEPEKAAETGGSFAGRVVLGSAGAYGGYKIGETLGGDVLRVPAGILGGVVVGKLGYEVGKNIGSKAGRSVDTVRNFLIKETDILQNCEDKLSSLFEVLGRVNPTNENLSVELNGIDSELKKLKVPIDNCSPQWASPFVQKVISKKMPVITRKTINIVKRIDKVSYDFNL